MPNSAKLPCHANPWQLDHGHGTNQTSSPLPPAPHCQIQRQGLWPATWMRGTASIVRPRGFRDCFVGVWLAKSLHLPSSSGETKTPQLSPPTSQGPLRLPLSQARVAARSAAETVTYLGQKAIQGWASKASAASQYRAWPGNPAAHRVNE